MQFKRSFTPKAHAPSNPAPKARQAGISSYTRAVNRRQQLGWWAALAGAIAWSSFVSAETKGSNVAPQAGQADAARATANTARAIANLADQAADAQVEPSGQAASPIEQAREGVVVIERRGKVLGLGSVLNNDGRVLTALSNIGNGNQLDARFADGSVMPLKVGHSERAWDLALLVPQSGRWTKGLKAGSVRANAAGTGLRTFTPLANKSLAPSKLIVRGLRTMQGADSELLRDAIELGSRFKASDVGSPIIDDRGHVVGMVGRACLPIPEQECQTVPYGVPVSAIRAFLRTAPENAVAPAPWLGIQGISADIGPVRGVRVVNIHPKSSAAAAGLQASKEESRSDVIVAVDGIPTMTPDALAEAINQRAVGDSVQLLLFGAGKFRQVSLGLTAAPVTSSSTAKQNKQEQAGTQAAPKPKNLKPRSPIRKRVPQPRPGG